MKPYLFPALVVGLIAFVLGGWLAGLGFALAVYVYGRHSYFLDINRDRKLLQAVRRDIKEVQTARFDTARARAYNKRYP